MITAETFETARAGLPELLLDAVAHGAAIGFMAGPGAAHAHAFCSPDVQWGANALDFKPLFHRNEP